MSSPFNKRIFVALAISITLHAAVFVLLGYGLVAGQEGRSGMHSLNLTLPVQISSPLGAVVVLTKPIATSVPVSAITEPVPAPAPALESALPEGEYYYHYYEVDTKSDFVDSTPLESLEKIISFNFEVKIKARVLINETGRVDSVAVLEAEPTILYNEAAINALLQSRFSPAEINGRKVKSQKILEIIFDTNRFKTLRHK